MTEPQRACWQEFRSELPWLHSAHRVLVRMASMLAARIDAGEVGVSATRALSGVLSKMAATPTDEGKVDRGEPDADDAADRFFGPPH